MKRDMELARKILFAIEQQYEPGEVAIFDLQIQGYEMAVVAEHCDLLHQQGLIKAYQPTVTLAGVMDFSVGNLTAKGYDYLELIRNEDIWDRTKGEIQKQGLPETFEHIARIAGVFVGNVIGEMSK